MNTVEELYYLFFSIADKIRHERREGESPIEGLTMPEARMVSIVYSLRDRISDVGSDLLAEMNRVSPIQFSQTIKSLIAKGVIERQHRSDDFRAVYYTLTPKGEGYGEMIRSIHAQDTQEAIEYLGEDASAALLESLKKIDEFLSKESEA